MGRGEHAAPGGIVGLVEITAYKCVGIRVGLVEDLGFSYAQLGQENSFGLDLLPGLRMQFEKLKTSV